MPLLSLTFLCGRGPRRIGRAGPLFCSGATLGSYMPCRGAGRARAGRVLAVQRRVGGRTGERFSLVPGAALAGRAFGPLLGDLCARMDPPEHGGKRPGRRRPRRREQKQCRAKAAGP